MTSIEERMKTKEELAEEYAKKEWPYWTTSEMFLNCKTDFLAGWDACNSAREKEEGWVSVKERLPELTEQVYWYNDDNERVPWEGRFERHVLAFDPEFGIIKARFDGKRFDEVASRYHNGTVNVTHWRPLPTPPTEETKQ
jgi:hypothetical protein